MGRLDHRHQLCVERGHVLHFKQALASAGTILSFAVLLLFIALGICV